MSDMDSDRVDFRKGIQKKTILKEENTFCIQRACYIFILMGKGLKLEELKVYQVAMEIGQLVWDIVDKWDYFPKKTLGGQFVKAADSIALNISEGYGRFHYKENKNFCYYSRGSAKETLTVTIKAKVRNLVTEEDFNLLTQKLGNYFRLIFGYIGSIGTQGNE
jgi:four helix bundle protein